MTQEQFKKIQLEAIAESEQKVRELEEEERLAEEAAKQAKKAKP